MDTGTTRYLVIAIGNRTDPATDTDVEALHEVVSSRLAPIVVTALSAHASARLTATLIMEALEDVRV